MPINNIGSIFNDLLQGQVSLERLEKFMFSEDIDTSYIKKSESENSQTAIKIKNGNFYWNKGKSQEEIQDKQESFSDSDQPILKNINMDIKKGSFVAILGELVLLNALF